MDSSKQNISKEEVFALTIDFLEAAIPAFDSVLSLLENNNGWFSFNDKVITFLTNLKTPWCTLYEDKNHLENLACFACFDEDELNKDSMNNFIQESIETLKLPVSHFKISKEDIEESKILFESLPVEDQKETTQEMQTLIYVFIAYFFNYLALMIHGRSMCQLVTDAKNGDDEAFRQAVHIDRTVLQLPYFQQRLLKSQFSNDEVFLKKLATSLRTPILKSKIKYRTLMFVFTVLDDLDKLNMPLEELLDICERLGVTGDKYGINDVGKLKNRRKEYIKKSRM